MRPAVPVPGPDVDIALGKAIRRLKAFYTPHELATEHILLGLACLEDESGQWLHDRGVQTDALEEEIRTLHFGSYVHDSPLPFVEGDEEEEAIALDGGEAIEVEEERGLTDEKEVESTLGSPHPSPLPAGEGTGVEQSELLDSQRVLRVIDAAANRAREGLRVAEDYVRFFLDDRHLTQAIKELRHELTAALRPFPLNERLGARDTQQDVGTDLDTPGERQRDGSGDVIAANFTRVQESLRSLEEFTKTTKSEASARFKQLRYRSYTLQRAVETTGTSCRRLHGARLYVLLDGRPTLEEFCRLAKELVAAGVHVVQLRDKTLDDRQLIQRARSLREITAAGKTLMIVNDRPDLAVLSQADGVHVGQEELSVKDARTIVGPRRLVGVSTHSIEQARRAVLDGASYIGVGPTFPSGTKAFPEFPGPTLLAAGGGGNRPAGVCHRRHRQRESPPGARHGHWPRRGQRSGHQGAQPSRRRPRLVEAIELNNVTRTKIWVPCPRLRGHVKRVGLPTSTPAEKRRVVRAVRRDDRFRCGVGGYFTCPRLGRGHGTEHPMPSFQGDFP